MTAKFDAIIAENKDIATKTDAIRAENAATAENEAKSPTH